MGKKNFVLDTNVLLHDHKCIFNFEENDIFIPIIVLEELDKFKKGNEEINYNAREFARQLDKYTDKDFFEKGAQLGPDLGRLSIIVNCSLNKRVKEAFHEDKPDHRILSAAIEVAEQHKDMRTIFVTKDINLRMKARALGIETEDYTNDKVKAIDLFENEHRTITDVSPDVIDAIYSSKNGIPVEQIGTKLRTNECFILDSGNSSVLARYVTADGIVRKVTKEKNFGIEPRNAEQAFAFDLLNDVYFNNAYEKKLNAFEDRLNQENIPAVNKAYKYAKYFIDNTAGNIPIVPFVKKAKQGYNTVKKLI